jgi:hypothetical protein
MDRGHLSDIESAQLAQAIVEGKESRQDSTAMEHVLSCPSCFYELQQSISEYWHLAGVDGYLEASAAIQKDQEEALEKKVPSGFRLLLRDLARGFRVLDEMSYYLATPMPAYRSAPAKQEELKSVQFVAFWRKVPVRVAVSKDIRGQWRFDFGALPTTVKEIMIRRESEQDSKMLRHDFGVETEHSIGLSSAQVFGRPPAERVNLVFYINSESVGSLELTRSEEDEMV